MYAIRSYYEIGIIRATFINVATINPYPDGDFHVFNDWTVEDKQ